MTKRKHDGHELEYRMDGVTTSQAAEIMPDGMVKILIPTIEVQRIDGDVYMVCLTCKERLFSGEDGLDDYWEAS